jgi:putative DNA primase/helicase
MRIVDVAEDFRAAMAAEGLETAEKIVADGVLHRVRWKDDKPGKRPGYYVLRAAGTKPAGAFGCWKRQIKKTWCAAGSKPLTKAERKALAELVERERQAREAERQARQVRVAEVVRAHLPSRFLINGDAHAYLRKKQVVGFGAVHGGKRGALLVPMHDAGGEVWNVQRVYADGTKLFLREGRVDGLYHRIGLADARRIIVVEGFATGASIAMAMLPPASGEDDGDVDLAVAVAFNAGNLEPVARAIRQRQPDAAIVVAGDDDHGTMIQGQPANPGADAARRAAETVGGRFILPVFANGRRKGDFNDLHQAEGLPVVRRQLEAAFAVPAAELPVETQGLFKVVREPAEGLQPGIYRSVESSEKKREWTRIGSKIEVLAQTRTDDNKEWGRLVAVHDLDGTRHLWPMPMAFLAGDGTAMRETLLSLGATISPGPFARNAIHAFLSTWNPRKKARCVTATGWHGRAFVLPDATYGETGGEDLHLQTAFAAPEYKVLGTVEGWRDQVSTLCSGNSRLVLAVSAAFAGPLLQPMKEESGGLHIAGPSSTGKTTTLHVASSIFGPPLQSWRTTDNAAEAMAVGASDTCLAIDEIGQADSRAVDQLAYMLANDAGKARMTRHATARPVARWRLIFLSTGELGLADKMLEHGKRVRGGQSVRVVEVKADAGRGLGLFEELHNHETADSLARDLRQAVAAERGAVGRAYLERLTGDLDKHLVRVQAVRDRFIRDHLPLAAPGQVSRVCGRFGLLAAAGELATAMGLVAWVEGEAIAAAGRVFSEWLEGRGGLVHSDVRDGLAAVRAFLEAHGSSRFEAAWSTTTDPDGTERPSVQRTIARAGFRRMEGPGTAAEWEYLIMPEAWRQDVCKGFDPTAVASAMAERGWLVRGEGKNLARKMKVPGYGSLRVYHITARFMGDEPMRQATIAQEIAE